MISDVVVVVVGKPTPSVSAGTEELPVLAVLVLRPEVTSGALLFGILSFRTGERRRGQSLSHAARQVWLITTVPSLCRRSRFSSRLNYFSLL